MKNIAKKALLVLCLLTLAACAGASFQRNAYNTLASAAEAYTATMQSLGALYGKGMITPEQKEKIIEHGEDFWLAYHTAVDVLDTYRDTGDDAPVYAALATMSRALGSFLEYAQTLQEGR